MINLKAQYNIVEIAGSTLGYKHRSESIEKMRSFVLSDDVRKIKALSTEKATAARRISITVENIKTNEKNEYISLTEASKTLKVSKAAVSQALLNNKVLLNLYVIKIKLYNLLNGW